MDNLTHGLVGYTIYKLAAPAMLQEKKTERRLLWASVLASELPDADMISALWGTGASLVWHRGFTHSLPGVTLLAVGLFFLFTKLWPFLPRQRLFGLLLTAGALHSFFDLLTSYGTRILLPWRQTPYAWDILPIIDPYLLAVLALLVWAGYQSRRKALIWALVVLMAGYVGWRVQLHDEAAAQVRTHLPMVEEIIVTPVIGGIKSWRFAARLPDGYSCGSVDVGGGVSPDVFIADVSAHPAVRAVAGSKTMAEYSLFARMIAYKLTKEDGLWHVMVLDPRYALPGRTIFTGHIWLDDNLNIVREEIKR